MDGFGRVEVPRLMSEDGLSRALYVFYLGRNRDMPFGVYLDLYKEETRQTKRHKWKADKRWSRLDKRNSNITKPKVDKGVMQEAVTLFRMRIRYVD